MTLSFKNLDTPCEDGDSCLAEKFSRLAELSDAHRRKLALLEDTKIEVPAGQTLIHQGSVVEEFFVIKKGWVVSSLRTTDGRRRVLDTHHPGDIVGMSQMPFLRSPFSSTTASNCILCPFPKGKLDDLLKSSPRLSGLFQSVVMIDQAILQDRIAFMSSEEAHIRLCHFMLQTFCRMKFMNDDLHTRFYCPLTQSMIGDAIGVTSVHTSRMFSILSDMHLVERVRGFVRFHDWDEAVTLTNFVDRFADISISWLPET